MFKKLYISLFYIIFSLSGYGIPAGFSSLEKEIGGDSIKNLTPDSFIIYISHIPGLAFKKAYRGKTMSEKKHFEAQYKLFLIGLALDCYKKFSSSDMFGAIVSQLQSFHAENLEATLTSEEKEYFETLAKEVAGLFTQDPV